MPPTCTLAAQAPSATSCPPVPTSVKPHARTSCRDPTPRGCSCPYPFGTPSCIATPSAHCSSSPNPPFPSPAGRHPPARPPAPPHRPTGSRQRTLRSRIQRRTGGLWWLSGATGRVVGVVGAVGWGVTMAVRSSGWDGGTDRGAQLEYGLVIGGPRGVGLGRCSGHRLNMGHRGSPWVTAAITQSLYCVCFPTAAYPDNWQRFVLPRPQTDPAQVGRLSLPGGRSLLLDPAGVAGVMAGEPDEGVRRQVG